MNDEYIAFAYVHQRTGFVFAVLEFPFLVGRQILVEDAHYRFAGRPAGMKRKNDRTVADH